MLYNKFPEPDVNAEPVLATVVISTIISVTPLAGSILPNGTLNIETDCPAMITG